MTVEDPYYHCLCGMHVHRGAYIIAVVWTVLSTLSIITNLVQNEILFAFSALIGLICYICVLYGHKTEKPNFYLPCIVLNTVSVVISIIFYVISIIAASVLIMNEKKKGNLEKKDVVGFSIGALVLTGTLLILYLIELYFIRVIYRARHYMINVLNQSGAIPHFTQSPVTPTVNNIL